MLVVVGHQTQTCRMPTPGARQQVVQPSISAAQELFFETCEITDLNELLSIQFEVATPKKYVE